MGTLKITEMNADGTEPFVHGAADLEEYLRDIEDPFVDTTEHRLAVMSLKVGESTRTGGGAGALFEIERME